MTGLRPVTRTAQWEGGREKILLEITSNDIIAEDGRVKFIL